MPRLALIRQQNPSFSREYNEKTPAVSDRWGLSNLSCFYRGEIHSLESEFDDFTARSRS